MMYARQLHIKCFFFFFDIYYVFFAWQNWLRNENSIAEMKYNASATCEAQCSLPSSSLLPWRALPARSYMIMYFHAVSRIVFFFLPSERTEHKKHKEIRNVLSRFPLTRTHPQRAWDGTKEANEKKKHTQRNQFMPSYHHLWIIIFMRAIK